MSTSQLSDEHFGAFLLAWVWIYLVPAGCFYVVDARQSAQALLLYLMELPSLWRSVIAWCIASDGRRAWAAARNAVQQEENAFEKHLKSQAMQAAIKRNLPTSSIGSSSREVHRIVAQLRGKTPKPEAYKSALTEFKAASVRRPVPHKDAILGLHLLQRTMLLLARFAMLGWIQRTFMYDPWAILGVAKLASAKEVERAFRQRSLALHQETGGDRKAFSALQEAKDFILSAASAGEGSSYSLPRSVNNVYVASVLAVSALMLPVICLCFGAGAISMVFPVIYVVSHVALLLHFFCVQLRFSIWTVLIVWWILHVVFALPALITRPSASRLFHPMALWSVWGPAGFILANWQGPDADSSFGRGNHFQTGANGSNGSGAATEGSSEPVGSDKNSKVADNGAARRRKKAGVF